MVGQIVSDFEPFDRIGRYGWWADSPCQPLLDVVIHLDRSNREGDWVSDMAVIVCGLEEC